MPPSWPTTTRGRRILPKALVSAARAIGLTAPDLRAVLYDVVGTDRAPRAVYPCPLTARELDVLRQLADGKIYMQVGAGLGLSTSTVRTHLHNIYGKLGASDRAQAVLVATQRGWIQSRAGGIDPLSRKQCERALW